MNHWLLKSEPDTFSITHLAHSAKKTTAWEGVRNYQARNYLRQMIRGDQAFFYHSNCKTPGIYGIVEITKEAYADPSAFDPRSPYFDEKSTPDKPRWFVVNVKLIHILPNPILLTTIKEKIHSKTLPLLRRGHRLSVMPVGQTEWKNILSLQNI